MIDIATFLQIPKEQTKHLLSNNAYELSKSKSLIVQLYFENNPQATVTDLASAIAHALTIIGQLQVAHTLKNRYSSKLCN